MKPFLYYLAAVSVLSCILTIHDKLAAKRHAWRVPERVLMLSAALGGSVSMYATMLIIRHKTKHPKFMVGIPAMIAVQVFVVIFIMKKYLGT